MKSNNSMRRVAIALLAGGVCAGTLGSAAAFAIHVAYPTLSFILTACCVVLTGGGGLAIYITKNEKERERYAKKVAGPDLAEKMAIGDDIGNFFIGFTATIILIFLVALFYSKFS